MGKAIVVDRPGPLLHSLPCVIVPEHGNNIVWSQHIANLLMIATLVLVATLPLVSWLADAHRHDQQRIGQVLTLALVVVITILAFVGGLRLPLLLSSTNRWLIMLVIMAAGVSAYLAHQPLWAFTELALGVASLGLAWLVASMRRLYGVQNTDSRIVDRVLLATLFLICAGLVVRFLTSYLAAMVGDIGILDAWLLVDGFSNPRFFGQFLTLALPLLAVPLLTEGNLRRYALVAGVLIVLVWTAAIVSGTRGTWLGLACAAAVLACIGPTGRRWAVLHLAAACAGVVLTWIMMTVIPTALDMSVAHHAASKLTTSLSLRDIIWTQAIEEVLSHPLLGIGPMQLADLPNGVAAHPHQAWLQWAAELGLPSALLVTGLVVHGIGKLVVVLRARMRSMQEQDVIRLCLAASIIAALTQAMVDGVLVMPYSQLWLALLAGWLIGLQPQAASSDAIAFAPRRTFFAWLAILISAVALLSFVVVRDYPNLGQREEMYAKTFGDHLQPRFWAQGVIADQ